MHIDTRSITTPISALVCTAFFAVSLYTQRAQAQEFTHKLDVQIRADDRSSSDLRYQYRLRYYPQLKLDDTWSVNAFAVTGDDYGSSHNTFDDGSADYFYLRRLYVRHQGDYGKTEAGIIPTYKGRVSSSGLSKDGWIKGVRHVRALGDDKLEVVVGQLTSLDPAKALNAPDEFDYAEIEYSAQINDQWSFELSAEHMTRFNFVRSELRYNLSKTAAVFGEIVTRMDETKIKTVLGVEGQFAFQNYPVEYFVHYSQVSDDFGLRAELTEDFLGTGNGFSGKLGGDIPRSDFGWFVRYDAVTSRTRVLIGLKWSV